MKSIQKIMKVFEAKNQSQLAKKLGCAQGIVSGWIKQGAISLKWSMRIEFLSEGQIKARELNPKEFKWIESKKKS